MKITDLTVEQLRFLIEEIVDRKLTEYLGDPKAGINLRTEINEKIKAQRMAQTVGIPDEQFLKELGINLEE